MTEVNKEEDMTTIWIKKSDVEKIEQIKIHPRVPNSEIISTLIDFWNKNKK